MICGTLTFVSLNLCVRLHQSRSLYGNGPPILNSTNQIDFGDVDKLQIGFKGKSFQHLNRKSRFFDGIETNNKKYTMNDEAFKEAGKTINRMVQKVKNFFTKKPNSHSRVQ
ncbi:hypothetical protein ACOME3_005305 [Neoechinorhynchus agilis]